MSTNEDDTDPSTPSARRSSRPSPRVEGTDPGVGDPVTEPIAVPTRPLNIVVPAPGLSTMTPTPPPAAAQQALLKHKDSVEILLDGMTDQRLDRTRTTPQSDGQASAAYHSAHTPPASERAPNDDVPKVLLDRPLTPTAVSPRPSPPAPARSYSSDATVLVAPERLGRRIAVAVMLGLLVAGVVLLLLEMTGRRPATSVSPSESPHPSATAGASTSVVGAPGPVSTAAAPSPPTSAAEAALASPVPVASSISTRGRVETAPVQPSNKRRTKAGPASSGDFGEFRTNF